MADPDWGFELEAGQMIRLKLSIRRREIAPRFDRQGHRSAKLFSFREIEKKIAVFFSRSRQIECTRLDLADAFRRSFVSAPAQPVRRDHLQ